MNLSELVYTLHDIPALWIVVGLIVVAVVSLVGYAVIDTAPRLRSEARLMRKAVTKGLPGLLFLLFWVWVAFTLEGK